MLFEDYKKNIHGLLSVAVTHYSKKSNNVLMTKIFKLNLASDGTVHA